MLSSHLPTNGFETDLGARVRALRRERGLTLKGLGEQAGLSHPFLSQVERGLARPSVGSVERIAAALDVSVARLWSPPRVGDDGRDRAQRRGRARRAGPARAAAAPPAPRSCASGPPATAAGRTSTTSQDGELAIYVARGSLEVDLNGTIHELAEGDTLRFDGTTPHRLRRTGGTHDARADRRRGLASRAPATARNARSAGGSPPASSVSAARDSAAIATPSGPGP